LIKKSLAVKCCYILVEINGEKIEAPYAGFQLAMIMLEIVMEIIGSFCGNWSDLLVTSSVTWDEEDGNSAQLFRTMSAWTRPFLE
jgi:hypothetical protein